MSVRKAPIIVVQRNHLDAKIKLVLTNVNVSPDMNGMDQALDVKVFTRFNMNQCAIENIRV